ncbi:uncharacterized protein LOC120682674 [Panicum virgatum]|uniref:uncharacterized protein LOC120682674 n=1 Tax=Panicum virgatum TaxID=38727 RepID=UPI0019D604B3|nr:uncharacterized protein LOC120682674 [Panicum virgatum]
MESASSTQVPLCVLNAGFLSDLPFSGICYHRGDIANYRHCHELDYMVKGISVECEACKEYLPFSTLALHQLDDCSFRQTLPKIAPGMPPMFNLRISPSIRPQALSSINTRK